MRSYTIDHDDYHFGGDAVESFGKYLAWMSKNTGRRHFKMGQNSAHDKDVPFFPNVETHLQLTSTEDMTQLSQTYINMTVKGIAHVAHNYTNTANAYKSSNKIFLGFKNSSEIFERLRFESNGNDTSYQQPHAIREQFAYHTYDSKIQKNNRKFTHLCIPTFRSMITRFVKLI
jgi:hypothetical protein